MAYLKEMGDEVDEFSLVGNRPRAAGQVMVVIIVLNLLYHFVRLYQNSV